MDITPDDPLYEAVFDQISAVFATPVPLHDALIEIMQRTCTLLAVDQAAFFVMQAATMRLMASNVPLPDPPSATLASDAVLDWVARQNQPLAILDPRTDRRFGQIPGWMGPLPAGVVPAVAAVPVRTSAGVAGVLVVIDLLAHDEVQADRRMAVEALTALLPFLLVMADLVALALENRAILRIQQRRSHFMRLLHLIATIPSSAVIDDLVQTMTTQVCAITQADAACILVHSPATDELIALGRSDPPHGERPRSGERDHIPLATSGPLLEVFRHGVPTLVRDDPALAALVLLDVSAIQSLLIVPLRVEQVIQGVVVVLSTRPDTFSADDLDFVSFISVRLSYALRQQTLTAELVHLEQQRIQQDARENVISLIAHDLKNILMTISGSGHLALRKLARGNGEYTQHALRVIVAKAAQASQLITDMVDVENLEQGRFRLFMAPVDLGEVVREEVEAAQMLSTRHTVQFQPTDMPLEVVADGPRLRQVLGNLLTNAIRYSPDGGTITITLGMMTVAPDPEAATSAVLPQAVHITISDPGIGISPADLPHIFDRFYRGRGETVATGTGLGLYIAAQIITQHGGTLWAESAPAGGTQVHVTLPFRRDHEAPGVG
jgi:signal transduction histidine kinase